jgi:hypothetical protein
MLVHTSNLTTLISEKVKSFITKIPCKIGDASGVAEETSAKKKLF